MKRLTALDDRGAGKPVDWWFMYKLPEGCGPAPAEGFNYLYFDANTEGRLALSEKTLDTGDSALHNTLQAVFDGNASYLLYNDESPMPGGGKSSSRGHCKGMLALDPDTRSGLLLVHSTPRFPAPDQIELPDKERKYGQTYLCITLESDTPAWQLAEQALRHHSPMVYASRLQDNLPADSVLHRLAAQEFRHEDGLASFIEIRSRGGVTFRSIAKHRRWAEDFWIDLVGPLLRTDLLVESWVRGAMPPERLKRERIEDVMALDFSHLGAEGAAWKETQDHAKWAVSIDQMRNMICVGDLNRMVSQEKRGGGTLAFSHPQLWKDLYEAHVHLHKAVKGK